MIIKFLFIALVWILNLPNEFQISATVLCILGIIINIFKIIYIFGSTIDGNEDNYDVGE